MEWIAVSMNTWHSAVASNSRDTLAPLHGEVAADLLVTSEREVDQSGGEI